MESAVVVPAVESPSASMATIEMATLLCLQCMHLHGPPLNLCTPYFKSLAKSRTSSSTMLPNEVTPYCKGLKRSLCSSNPCKNGGVCSEGMRRFKCDCSNISFMGTTCEIAVVTTRFDGSQLMNFPMDTTIQTGGEDISLRFRTPARTGLMLATTSNSTKDSLMIELVKGKIQLSINIGCSSENCTALRQGPDILMEGEDLNDRQWHNVKVSRRGRRVSLDVDGRRKGKTLSGKHSKLEFDVIHLGKIVATSRNNVINASTSIMVTQTSPFVGHLENVVFNSVHLIDRCFAKTLSCNDNSSLGDTSSIVSFPVTFRGDDSYVVLPTLNAYKSMDIYLSLKTTVKDGLLLYNSGRSGDYIAIEMVEGKIFYLYNLGNGEQVLSVPGASTVNDNKWHDIGIIRNENNIHKLVVDGALAYNKGSNRRTNLDLNGYLYIGGVKQDMFRDETLPNNIASRVGFQGCLGNIDLNGELSNINGPKKIRSNGAVTNGCNGPSQVCSNLSCSNGGICLQQWYDFICDCSMTTYAGKTCEERAVTYRFGASNGLMLFRWVGNFPSSRNDTFALGFSTTQRNAALVKVMGSTDAEIQDFLELKIVNGKLTLRFNLGGQRDVVFSEPTIVSDGQYHRCLVKRNWMNASISLDDKPEKTHFQSGDARERFQIARDSIPVSVRPTVSRWLRIKEQTTTVFNSQSTILIGGLVDLSFLDERTDSRKRRSVSITQPFRGQMVGFFYNKVRVFDLAADGDPQITMYGEVVLVGRPPAPLSTFPPSFKLTTTMATLTTFSTTHSTDNVVESRGNGCKEEDLELCSNSSEIYTGSVPIVDGKAESLSLAMIIGIASSSICCVLILLFVMYRCRSRETLRSANKQERDKGMNGAPPNKGKQLTAPTNGNIIREKSNITNHNPDKEVFV